MSFSNVDDIIYQGYADELHRAWTKQYLCQADWKTDIIKLIGMLVVNLVWVTLMLFNGKDNLDAAIIGLFLVAFTAYANYQAYDGMVKYKKALAEHKIAKDALQKEIDSDGK